MKKPIAKAAAGGIRAKRVVALVDASGGRTPLDQQVLDALRA